MTGPRVTGADARLYVECGLSVGAVVPLSPDQSHYLLNVLRLKPGDAVGAFNGADGEWSAVLQPVGKRVYQLIAETRLRDQDNPADLWLIAAPIKGDRINYVVEKATELGVSRILPVLTSRTVVGRVNLDRLRSRAREAAQQSERMSVPRVDEALALAPVLAAFPTDGLLIVCDETGTAPPIADTLRGIEWSPRPLAVLIGPEGGFAPEELDVILKLPFARPVSLGPRVLRADTAAFAAISVVQAILGDWRQQRSHS